MVSYKLYYFNIGARAEVIRQIFAYTGTPYEDIRMPRESWAAKKSSFPFGTIPVLEVDGKQIPQSLTIARYLARQHGLAGKGAFEEAWVDAIGDQFMDYHEEIRPYFVILGGFREHFSAEEKDKVKKEVGEVARDKFYPITEKILKANQSGYLVGDGLTWVDLLISEHVATLTEHQPTFLEKFPEALAHSAKIRAIPQIKEWIEKRPKTLI